MRGVLAFLDFSLALKMHFLFFFREKEEGREEGPLKGLCSFQPPLTSRGGIE